MWGKANDDFFFSDSKPKPKENDNSKKIEDINACITNLEKAQNHIQMNVEQCINKINTDFDELISTMNDRKTILLQKLNNISKTKKTSLNMEINKMRNYLDSNNNNNNNQQWPSQHYLDNINKLNESYQNEIFYTNNNGKQRFIVLMNDYGDISLPLNKPSILYIRNNSRNYDINFKWKIKKINDNEDYKINKVEIEWKNMDEKENENVNINTINIINNDSNIYENTINVFKNGTYSLRIKYFECCLQVWSKLSDLKFISINKINEEFIIFDIYDRNYIDILENNNDMISGNGLKKGKYARMISCSNGYNVGLYEWKIKCIEYDSSSQAGNASHAIGIFTNNEIASNGTNWVNDKRINYAYYWNSYRRYIYGSCSGEYIFENNVNNGWKTGDIITIFLDCNNWTIQFKKNEDIINNKPYKIKPNKTYYPLIVMRSHNDKYQVLTYQ